MRNTEAFQAPTFILKACLAIILLITGYDVTAQTDLSRVNIYAQVGAVPGIEGTVNAEIRLHSGDMVTWYGRGGVGFGGLLLTTGGPGGSGSITMLTGKKNNHFELNGGIFIGHDQYYSDTFYLPILDLGYRYQNAEGGFIFKAKAGVLGVGLGLGYAF